MASRKHGPTRRDSQHDPQQELVVKSNDLVRAKIDWTTVEHRVTLKLVSQLRKDDKEFSYQTVRIKDVIQLSGSKSNDLYSRAEEICEKLLGQKIRVRERTPSGNRKYKGYNLMSACEYVEGSGRIRAKFNPDMRPFLLELKRRFTMYRLQFVMQLSTPYAIRFYEIIKMREDLRFVRIPIEELREILCVENKYERFTDLKKYVIEPARKEIKDKCDVYFTYRVEREGRTPKRVNLMIHPNDDIDPPVVPQLENSTKASEEKSDVGPSDPGRFAPGAEESTAGKQGGLFVNEEPQSPPKLDARVLFLQDLSQEELSHLSDAEIDRIHERAKKNAENNNPGSGKTVLVSETFRDMRRIWKEEYAPSPAE